MTIMSRWAPRGARGRYAGVLPALALAASLALAGCGATQAPSATASSAQESGAGQEQADTGQQELESGKVAVSTPYGDLFYSDEWDGVIDTSQEQLDDGVRVTFTTDVDGTTYDLYTVTIGGTDDDGLLAGHLTGPDGKLREVHIAVGDHSNLDALDGASQDRIYAMTDGVNVLIDNLED